MDRQRRILIADDDATFRDVVAVLLRQKGYECDTAADAMMAQTTMQNNRYDVVIANIGVSGSSDMTLVSTVLRNANHPAVILVTDHPDIETAVRAANLPVMGYLVKPVDMSKLMAAVDQAIALSRSRFAIQSLRQRLEDWCLQLALMDMTIQPSREALEALSGLVDAGLSGIDDRAQSQGQMTAASSAQFSVTQREELLARAVEEAIETLERTKRSFKSRDLAELRAKLENVLRGA